LRKPAAKFIRKQPADQQKRILKAISMLPDPNWRVGRPRKDIPDDIFRRLAAGKLTYKAAAKEAGVALSTFQNRYAEWKQTA